MGATLRDRHLAATTFLKSIDNDWARAIDLIGPCTHDPDPDRSPYEALVRAVGYQQLTAKAGDAILKRLTALFPDTSFPSPAQILALAPEQLRACGFSGSKSLTVQAIAAGAQSGLVPPRAQADAMEDEELIARLTTIRGIGRWTVEMLLMNTMGRPDILPIDDFGVREGYRALKSLPEQPKPRALREIGLAWSPYRTIASWYLWRVPRQRGNVLA